MIVLLLFLTACSDKRKVDLSGFDLTDLNNCMIAFSDSDQNTNCDRTQQETYIKAYSDYFLDRFDDEGVLSYPQFFGIVPVAVSEDIVISISYTNIAVGAEGIDYDMIQEIFEQISYDITELTDVYTQTFVRFAFQNYVTFTFVAVNNQPNGDDFHTREISMATQDDLVPEMFDDAFQTYLPSFGDKSYWTTTLEIITSDYKVIININPTEKEYQVALTENKATHFITEQEINDKLETLLDGYDLKS